MSNDGKYEMKTTVTVYDSSGKTVADISTDSTGFYIHVPGKGLSLPMSVVRAAMERLGVVEP